MTADPLVNEKIFEHAEAVAKEFNLPLLKVESNVKTFVKQKHVASHTYKDVLIMYALQKLWRIYYYSSAFPFSDFSLDENLYTATGHFDPFLLDCFSTSNLRIIPAGSEGDRDDKINFIADNPIVQKYLHVCIKKPFNCGKCFKCLRMLLALDAADKLEEFRESFDIDDYLKKKKRVYGYLNNRIKEDPNHPFLAKSYKILYERHKKLFDKLNAKK